MACGGRCLADRGVALVEYALALSLIVVVSIGAVQALEDNTSDEVDNQANCISERPPPPSCQLAPLAPTTTTTAPPSGTFPPGTPGNPIPVTVQNTSVTATADDPLFDVVAEIELHDDTSAPVPDELIDVKITINASSDASDVGKFFLRQCTTDGNGVCTLAFDSRWPGVTQLEFDVIGVGTETTYEYDDFTPVVVDEPAP